MFQNIDALPLGNLVQPSYSGKKMDKKKKTKASQMRAPQMEKMGVEAGTREGYGATPDDMSDPRKPIPVNPGPKPSRPRLGDAAKKSIEADAKKKNKKKV